MKRRRLFSDAPGLILRTLRCRDCGQELETTETPSSVFCPKCGGRRFDIVMFPHKYNPEEGKHRESEKEFSRISLFKDNMTLDKCFSELTISVTKTLTLDPSIMSGETPKDVVIDRLEREHRLPPKAIILIKRHIDPVEPTREFDSSGRIRVFSDPEEFTDKDHEWVSDSKIIPDITREYYNTSMSLSQFRNIIKRRYPDAPTNILQILEDEDVIQISGNQVTIHNNKDYYN